MFYGAVGRRYRCYEAFPSTFYLGCCAVVRRSKNGTTPSRGYCFKNHQNKKRCCIISYLRSIWVDSLLLLLFGVLNLGLHFAPNNRHDLPLMPLLIQSPAAGNVKSQNMDLRVPVEYLFPYKESPLSDLMGTVLVGLVPVIVIGSFQLKLCSV